jgi:hypothetical protein
VIIPARQSTSILKQLRPNWATSSKQPGTPLVDDGSSSDDNDASSSDEKGATSSDGKGATSSDVNQAAAIATAKRRKAKANPYKTDAAKRASLHFRAYEPDWFELAERFPDEGYSPILTGALQYAAVTEHRIAIDLKQAMIKNSESMYMDNAVNTLCVMPKRLVKEIVAGSVAQVFRESSPTNHLAEFHKIINDMDNQGGKQACIYMLELAGSTGQPMSVEEVRKLIWELRYYKAEAATHNKLAFEYDSLHDPDWKTTVSINDGRRKYIEDKPTERRAVVDVFCSALEKLIHSKRDEEDFLPRLTYIGYAIDADKRKKQHAQTGSESKNWLASLVLSICKVRWPYRGFKLHAHVICLLGDEKQAAIAEMLLAVISQSYYWTGRGFNIVLAGGSLASIEMKKKTSDERNQAWEDWKGYILNSTPWKENLAWVAEKTQKRIEDTQCAPIREEQAQLDAEREEMEEIRGLLQDTNWDDPKMDPAFRAQCAQMKTRLLEMDRKHLNLFRGTPNS